MKHGISHGVAFCVHIYDVIVIIFLMVFWGHLQGMMPLVL